MTTPFPFVASQILTAAELNSITNLPSSTKTANYVLTVANMGSRVVMNAAGSTTITVNTSIFSAGDIVELSNIGVGVCTVTAGTATVSSAGPLAIPQYGGGRLVFSSASAATYFPAAVTVAAPPASGLTFISSTAFSGTTASITNCFSATYTAYRVYIDQVDLTPPGANAVVRLQFDTTTADYSYVQMYATNAASWVFLAGSTSTSFIGLSDLFELGKPNDIILDITNPFTTLRTSVISLSAGYGTGQRDMALGSHDANTSFTGLKLLNATGANMTGTVRVYGLANS